MPDDKTVDNIPNGDAHNTDGSMPANADNIDTSVFDNMTDEELRQALAEKSKSFNELHSKMGQVSGELGELRKFRKEVEGQSQLADAISAVKELVSEKEKKPEFDYESWEAEVLAKAEENPAEALRDALRATSAWQTQGEAKLKSEYEAQMAELKAQIGTLTEAYQTTTDDYKENKELIETLREGTGMSLAQATKLAKELRSKMPDAGRTTPPQGVNPTRVIAPDRKTEKPWTDEDVQRWKREGRSEAFIENMKAKWERDAQLTNSDREKF